MKKILIEILVSAAVIFIPTAITYSILKGNIAFWNAQNLWSVALGACWVSVASGYYHQGRLVRSHRSSKNVSLILPITVFFVQCILFVKGVYYQDWSLLFGAVIVNSGVVFSCYEILKNRRLYK